MKKIIISILVIIVVGVWYFKTQKPEQDGVLMSEIDVVSESLDELTFSLEDVSKHSTEDDCWTAVDGEVFDLTPFISSHPGGVANITKICGIDGTTLFEAQHGQTPRAQGTLTEFKIGVLE